MTKQFCKKLLESNQSGIYTLVIENYTTEILEFGPTVFKKWLAEEIDIEEEKINLSSLNSALKRFKKGLEKNSKKRKEINDLSENLTNIENTNDFQFSSVDSFLKKSRTTEM